MSTLTETRYPTFEARYKEEFHKHQRTEAEAKDLADVKKLFELAERINDSHDHTEEEKLSPLEVFIARTFSRFKDLQSSVESQYRQVVKAIKERTGAKFKIQDRHFSAKTKQLTVFKWLDGLIRNQRKGISESNELEEAFAFLRNDLGINIPFHRGMVSEIRAGIELNKLVMSDPTLERIVAGPFLDPISRVINYIKESPKFLDKFISSFEKGKMPITNRDQVSLEKIKSEKTEKNISLDRLGIDYLIKVASEDGFEYIPVQIKTREQSAEAFPRKKVTIHLNHRRLDELKTKVDDPVINGAHTDKIVFKRKIPALGIEDKNLSKINSEMAELLETAPRIKLDQEFSPRYEEGKISNLDFIAELVKQGFLNAVEVRD